MIGKRSSPNLRFSLDWNRCERMLSWPNLKYYMDWNLCDRVISRPICSTMWIRKDDA
jgi:hypothetical protein